MPVLSVATMGWALRILVLVVVKAVDNHYRKYGMAAEVTEGVPERCWTAAMAAN